ncbi:hypothetical protein C9374_004756 [Naegleria lovaniensis]|uniref:G domain-containing protein n=1 Tax=Naegleria lovaniensis TaxID=51637 RepID=A0AA88KIG3_NAELO|nr:uncharacterized protein C9374_004756 [Naegleria lovaniensis]KAG2382789.1 hypothetical protein C9374_004756 [Naegleria lovaniensis]
MPATLRIFDSVHGSLDEDELTVSQQRQIALMRKRREDRLIIPTIHRSDSSMSSATTNPEWNNHHDDEDDEDEEDQDEDNEHSVHHHKEISEIGKKTNSTIHEEVFDPRKNVYDNNEEVVHVEWATDTEQPHDPKMKKKNKKALNRRLSTELMKHFMPTLEKPQNIQETFMDKQAVELLKNMDPEIVEKCILPFLSVRDLLSLGLTSKNQLTISWTCLRIINEIHLKRFPHLLSNAMIEDQMDRVMAILMMKFSSSQHQQQQQQQNERTSVSSVASANRTSDSSSSSMNGERRSTTTSYTTTTSSRLSTTLSDTRGSFSSNSGRMFERRSWRLNDSAPLTSATLARRSIVEVYSGLVDPNMMSHHHHACSYQHDNMNSESQQQQQQQNHSSSNSILSSATHHEPSNTTAELNSSQSTTNHDSMNSPARNANSFQTTTTPTQHRMSMTDAASHTSTRHTISEYSAHTFLGHIHQQQPHNDVSSMVIQPLPSEYDPNVGSFTKLVTSVKRKTRRKIFRIAVVGEVGVGKSTFIDSIFGHTMPVQHTEYSPTEKVSTYCHPYYLLTGERIELIIHDTPQIIPTQYKTPQKFQSINEKYSDNAKILRQSKKKVDLFLYCFDMSNPNTLPSETNEYFKELRKVRDAHFPKSTLALIGLKRDIAERNLKHLTALSLKKKKKKNPTLPPKPVSYIQATETAQQLQCFKAFLGCCDMKNMFNTLHLFDIGVSLMYGQIMMKRFSGIEEQITSPKRRSVSFINSHHDHHEHFSASPYAASVSTPVISRHAATISTSSPSRARKRLSIIGKKVGEGFQVLFDKFSPSHSSRDSTTNSSSFDRPTMNQTSGEVRPSSNITTITEEPQEKDLPSPIQPHTMDRHDMHDQSNPTMNELNSSMTHLITLLERPPMTIIGEPVLTESSCVILDDVSSTHSSRNLERKQHVEDAAQTRSSSGDEYLKPQRTYSRAPRPLPKTPNNPSSILH